MDIRRVILYGALGLVAYTLWMNWQKDYPPMAKAPVLLNSTSATDDNSQLLPEVRNTSSVNDTKQSPSLEETKARAAAAQRIVSVVTDVFNISIDLNQGDIVNAQLRNYPTSVEDKNKPYTLLQNNEDARYVADSSLFVVDGQGIKNLDFNYQVTQPQYEMSADQRELIVELQSQNAEGINVVKRFIFTRGSYLIKVEFHITNAGNTPWEGYMNTQLLRSSPAEDKSSMFHVGSYTGASYSEPGKHRYQKVSFKDMSKANLNVKVQGGWVAMQQHYFLSAWIPDEKMNNRFYTRAKQDNFTIGSVSQLIELNVAQKTVVGSRLYIGPEDASVLHQISPGLDLTIDYGWLWFLSSMLFSVMRAIHAFVGNWGWSIVLVTVLIKIVFYKLSATSYKSMANMRRLQPKIAALRERFGDDKAKLSQATMEFYRQEKVNPLGGCLPILIQIPVFIALYWVLIESVELRQAPFILWINDLAAADPFHVLPIIMGATMLIQQRLNPAPPDPMQAKIMMFLPVLFTALFWGFPAGLVLYWIVNNTLSILQQWYITRKYSEVKPTSNKSKIVSVK
jgi:YidC/Oxa1 family membrane protein insertase